MTIGGETTDWSSIGNRPDCEGFLYSRSCFTCCLLFERNRLMRIFFRSVRTLRTPECPALGDCFAGRLAAQLVHEMAAGANQLVDRLVMCTGNTNRARLVGDGARMAGRTTTSRTSKTCTRAHSTLPPPSIRPIVAFLNSGEDCNPRLRIFLEIETPVEGWPRSILLGCSASVRRG